MVILGYPWFAIEFDPLHLLRLQWVEGWWRFTASWKPHVVFLSPSDLFNQFFRPFHSDIVAQIATCSLQTSQIWKHPQKGACCFHKNRQIQIKSPVFDQDILTCLRNIRGTAPVFRGCHHDLAGADCPGCGFTKRVGELTKMRKSTTKHVGKLWFFYVFSIFIFLYLLV